VKCPKCMFEIRKSGDCFCTDREKEGSVEFIMDYHDSYWDPGLGEVVKSRQHRNQLMKEKGVREVGNEWKYVDPARKRAEKERKYEQSLEEGRREIHKVLADSNYEYRGDSRWN